MNCPIFSKRWTDSDRSKDLLSANHAYTIGDGSTTPVFVRLDDYLGAEPVRDIDKVVPCECGAPDRWKCWHGVKCNVLLGRVTARQEVSTYGTKWFNAFPEDERVNVAIITTAMKLRPWSYTDNAIPPDEVRDLCAHLAEQGVRRYDDGSFDVRFLRQEAKAYLAMQRNTVSVNKYIYSEANNKDKTNV